MWSFHSIGSYLSPRAWRQRRLWHLVERQPNTPAILATKAELASLPLYELTLLNCNRLLDSIQLFRRSSTAPAPALPRDGSGVAHFELCALYLHFADRIAGNVLSHEEQLVFSPALASHLLEHVASRIGLTPPQAQLIFALWMARVTEYFEAGGDLRDETLVGRIVAAFSTHLVDVLELDVASAPLIETAVLHDGVDVAANTLINAVRLPSLLEPNATVVVFQKRHEAS